MYLGAEVEGDVMDMVALISLIIGALLDRLRLTMGQSTSMVAELWTVRWSFALSVDEIEAHLVNVIARTARDRSQPRNTRLISPRRRPGEETPTNSITCVPPTR